MPRAICPHCHFPQSVCLCEFVRTISSETHFDILQHPSEQKAAKNTARLCELCLPNLTLWPGESVEDFSELRQLVARELSANNVALLYPSEQSITLEDWQKQTEKVKSPKRILVLDGTWKKAYKLYQLNEWLWQIPAVRLENLTSEYHIRKSSIAGGVSTLEAVQACIHKLEPKTNTDAMTQVFRIRQEFFLAKKH